MGKYTRVLEIMVEVEVEFDFVPGCQARMYMPNGDPGYPAEPAEWLIDEVRIGEGDHVQDIGDSISSAEMDEIEQQLNDAGMDDYE